MYLGNSPSWKRRLDDLRYLPGDVVRRLQSLRERLLSNWAGYSTGQRLSTAGLTVAVMVALAVALVGGGAFGDGSDLVVATDGRQRPTTTERQRPDAASGAASTVAASSGTGAPDSSMELSMIDNSAVVDGFDDDAVVMGATTVAGRSGPRTPVDPGLAGRFQAAFQPPPPGVTPAATTPPVTAPVTAPATTTPRPVVTSPPPTTPPPTAPPVTAPPTTNPPATVPPTTAAPATTAPPATVPPTTAPPAP